MFPSIDPGDVGATGLVWLFISYGYVLYYASNFISEGSDLLLLVPSMSGFVGGTVLPLLGAIPDGAILLFSGLGDIETAQETLSVGVGALAGSTIMLLTIPLSLSVIAGRVELVGPYSTPNYKSKPKLITRDLCKGIFTTGVSLTEQVHDGALVMMITSLPYFLIQIPATIFTHRDDSPAQVARDERNFALTGLIICLIGFVSYLWFQVKTSQKGADKLKRIMVLKKKLHDGTVSLSGAMGTHLMRTAHRASSISKSQYQAIISGEDVPADELDNLAEVLRDAFRRYDRDNSGTLEKAELKEVLRDLNEPFNEQQVNDVFDRYDRNKDHTICFDEFLACIWCTMVERIMSGSEFYLENIVLEDAAPEVDGAETDQDEEEDLPETIASLPPERQQQAIMARSFLYLGVGATLVAVFSDPMVDVLGELAKRMHISPFYVSFVLAPLASNASEVIASRYYASKKTRKSMTVSFTALEGAASMNNTFCLSILLGLIYMRGLAWEYTAETISILFVLFCVGFMTMKSATMTVFDALLISFLFPLSIAMVAVLEAVGFD